MALIKCPNCNHEISDTAKRCIHCKTKIKSNNNTLKINYKLVIPTSIVILFLIVGFALYFIVYKIDDNQVYYDDTKQNIEETQTNDESDLNNNQDNSNDNNVIENNTNSNNENEESNNIVNNNSNNDSTSTNTNTNSDNNSGSANSNSSDNNTNDNTDTPTKIIIDATENKSCPSGYNLGYSGSTCKKIDIIDGNITYYCLLDNLIQEGNKCKWVHTSKPTGGSCHNGATLNNGVCESITYVDASTRLTCPDGYSKYDDTRCYRWLEERAVITYSCPSGYTLNGDKCEK